jgi:hypothetical protein
MPRLCNSCGVWALEARRDCSCAQKWGKIKCVCLSRLAITSKCVFLQGEAGPFLSRLGISLECVFLPGSSYLNHVGMALSCSPIQQMPSHAYFTVYPKCAWLVVASCCACVGICRHVCFSMGVSRATAIAALRCICGRSYIYIYIGI